MFIAKHFGIPGLRHPASPSAASRNDENYFALPRRKCSSSRGMISTKLHGRVR
jgi:hypothetical protein